MTVRYLLAWFGLAVIAIGNGVLRESTYGNAVSDLAAHQISTATGILLTGAFVYLLSRAWPIESTNQAWLIGVLWLVFTVVFEFGFGHYVAGHSWNHLFADYNILNGRVWGIFLVWVLVMPYVAYKYS